MISYQEAYKLTIQNIQPMPAESVTLLEATGRVAAEDLRARVDAPTVNVSLKDGYAVHPEDIAQATADSPVRLTLLGTVAAGGAWQAEIGRGQTVRILSGAPVPEQLGSVLTEEFTSREGDTVLAFTHAAAGRNILLKGSDVHKGEVLAKAGETLRPTLIGLLAAGGYEHVPVVRQPQVHILATGDEVLAPGEPLLEGKLYASNLVTLAAWCRRYGFAVQTQVVPDDAETIRDALHQHLSAGDALLTSGGAWKGERDLTVRLLDELGWQKTYHRVRIGPGKAIGFGMYQGKPVFCLPGGPPSNHMAFIQLALPGLQKLAGFAQPGLPRQLARLKAEVHGQIDWTQFIHGRMEQADQELRFHPILDASRLQMMAHTDAVLAIPEGVEKITAGEMVWVQML
ncbi:MAG: molybdopterin molybdotransferase MoeA [Anaerolineales bacterium]